MKQKQTSGEKEAKWTDGAAARIADTLLRFQLAISKRLNVFFAKQSLKAVKVCVVLFCLLTGGLSAYIIVHAICAHQPDPAYAIEQSRIPLHQSGDESDANRTGRDTAVQNMIHTYRRYLDSLRLNHAATFDSLVHARPQLLDSLRLLEHLYFETDKTEVYEP